LIVAYIVIHVGYLHTSNPGYDGDDTSCPLKNNGILFHKAKNLNLTYIMHISTACPGGTPPGQPGGNEGEFGILSVYSAREPRLTLFQLESETESETT
jgi:hypothetical protein